MSFFRKKNQPSSPSLVPLPFQATTPTTTDSSKLTGPGSSSSLQEQQQHFNHRYSSDAEPPTSRNNIFNGQSSKSPRGLFERSRSVRVNPTRKNNTDYRRRKPLPPGSEAAAAVSNNSNVSLLLNREHETKRDGKEPQLRHKTPRIAGPSSFEHLPASLPQSASDVNTTPRVVLHSNLPGGY